MPFSGQLWYITEGGDADTKLVRVNDDGTSSTTVVSNGTGGTGDDAFVSSFTSGLGVDTAAGFYFAVLSNSIDDHALLVRGSINSAAAPTTVVDFPDAIIVETIEVDAVNRRIYVGYQDGAGTPNGNITGIRVYSYDAAGALTDLGFLTTAATDNRANESGFFVLDPRDFAIDTTIVAGGRMYYTETIGGLATGLFRVDLANPNTTTVALVADGQFNNTTYADGVFVDVEVDESTDLVYFTTHSRNPSPSANYDANDNALWYISGSASGGTAVKVNLTGMPGGNHFYAGDMTFDQSTRQLYIESEEVENGGTDTDDVIYVFQLDGAGTSASLIRTINPGLTIPGATVEGMVFTDLAALTVTGAGTAATEQAASATTLLSGSPTIVDNEGGYLIGATVQITGGTFSSNENSTSDDHLGYGAGMQITGTIAGTSITVSWNASTETLTLSGYDTIAHYQTALAGLVYWATGDNPTNYGANASRTITWTIDDGTPGVLAGSVNSGTTTINITAANDAPVNGTVSSATGNENTNIAVTGLQISDVDADPASALVTVTLSVTKGVLTLRTNVASGLLSGDIVGNGTSSVTVTATINKINLTLASSNGLVFLGNASVSGTDTLTVVTSDGGATGSGGAQSDTDGYTITIIGLNDAPTVSGDGTEALAATNEDLSPTTLANTVSSLFGGQYTDPDGDAFAGVAVIDNGSTAGTGQWQYWNGSTWLNIGSASTAVAVELSASTAIRFAPATDFNGPAPTLTVRLVDASNGAITTGAVVNTTTNGGTTAFSAGTVVLSHAVTAVNDAPTVTGGSAVSLTSIAEDSAPGAGQTISTLFSSHFSDVKDTVSGGSSANGLTGVAVTANAATAAQGVYQYFDGSVWQDLPAVATSSAFILDASTLVRFVPAANYNGTAPSLTVSLIDDSSGAVSTGATADLTTVGGSTPYSASLTLNVAVTATNDAPVANGLAILAAVSEDSANPAGAAVSSLFTANFVDIDGNSLAGVAITGNAATTQGVWQYFAGSWQAIGSPSEGSALLLAAGTLVRFLPAANFTGAVPALTAYLIDNSSGALTTGNTLDVSVNGGQTRISDNSITLTTSITAVNDAPVVPASATTVGATEQTAAVLLGSLAVSDVDLNARNGGAGNYSGASFAVQRASANAADVFSFASGGLFTVSGANLQAGGLTFATFTNAGGVLSISFTSSATTATTALVNDVIQHIEYTNASNAPPASVSLDYSLNDGGGQGSGGALSAGGSVTVNITAVNDAHTGGASITGTAAEDQVLTAVSTLVDVDGLGTLHYQWQRDDGGGFFNVGADQSTYTLGDADINGMVRAVIYYTDAGGTVESATSAATATVTAGNDAPTGGASITGTPTENQVLTADTSTLADSDGLGTLHYQWQHDIGGGYVNVGADQATYTLGDSDVGGLVRVVVSYTDGQGFANSVTSSGTAAIAGVNDPHTGGAGVTGTATENQVLTAVSTLADIDGLGTLHYQWQHDVGGGYVNVGADQATYTLGDSDVGGFVRVVISYTDGQGFAESATSAATASIANVNDAPTGAVSITGTKTENQVLTADTAALVDIDGLGTLHYQWQRNTGGGFVNVGTDQATYTLGDPDVGGTVRVVVSYTDQQGTAETVTSAATAAIAGVNDPHTGGASITGTATEDQVLTAVSTLADVDGLGALHYQWQHDIGGGYVNVGADQATYTLSDSDVGGLVRVVISYTDGQGFAESATSAATAAIANANDAPTAANDVDAVTQRLTVTGTVRANDSDIDNTVASLTVTNVAYNATHVDQTVVPGGTLVSGAHGKLTINPDGTYSYVADHEGLAFGEVVTDKFDYTIKDPSGASATAQLTVTITGSLDANNSNNILISNGLAHTLTGKGGADTLTGGGGADVFAYEAISDSTIAAFDTITDFTHGVDTLQLTPLMTGSTKLTLSADATGRTLSIDLNGDGTAEGQIRSLGQGLEVADIVTGVANLGFTINGSAGGDVLLGGSGADIINGSGGADTIYGNGGGDILSGGAGADTFVYDDGHSPILHWDVITDFQTGQDKLNIAAADDGIVILARFGACTFIYFGTLGNSSVVQVFGEIRTSDLIVSNHVTFSMFGDDGAGGGGGGSSDSLSGGSGDDVLVGGTTDSTMAGGDGADIMYGGSAHDTFMYDSTTNSNFSAYDSVIGFTPNEDKIDISAIDGGKITIARFSGTTFIYSAPDGAGNFQSVITVSGTTLQASDIIGSGGATQAFTMVGDSTAQNIADTVVGAGGNDILYGLDGNDTLTGAGGADFMIGGAGADTFVYNAPADSGMFSQDLIFDFSQAEGDKLSLTGIDANAATGANDAFSVVTSFSSVAGQLIVAAPDASGYYHVSGDVNGDGLADFMIALKVTGTLTSADILL
ncbi:M10 family metallopeptidase C-terminal domain-containing protein [Caulobacter sp.]|uniref:M10 family metallopeptidase C-terminal domain-containing protein n=1 Tax=Caulobacter sp. TaxID=78 RepID=UPI003BAEA31F